MWIRSVAAVCTRRLIVIQTSVATAYFVFPLMLYLSNITMSLIISNMEIAAKSEVSKIEVHLLHILSVLETESKYKYCMQR